MGSFTPVFAVTRSAQGLNDGNLRQLSLVQSSLHGQYFYSASQCWSHCTAQVTPSSTHRHKRYSTKTRTETQAYKEECLNWPHTLTTHPHCTTAQAGWNVNSANEESLACAKNQCLTPMLTPVRVFVHEGCKVDWNRFVLLLVKVNMVLNVHRNHEAY